MKTYSQKSKNRFDFEYDIVKNNWDPALTLCNECELYEMEESCNKCGEAVCSNNLCCELFPHYSNTNFIICRSCVNEVDKKLQVLFDYKERDMHLQLLKIKIKKRLENKIEKNVEVVLQKKLMDKK